MRINGLTKHQEQRITFAKTTHVIRLPLVGFQAKKLLAVEFDQTVLGGRTRT